MSETPSGPAGLLPRVDHLVYAAPDLERAIEEIETLLGVRAIPGGRHPGWGTRNALLGLGPAVYLEIIAPDADQPAPPAPRHFGIDRLTRPRLATWAAKGSDLERLASEAGRQGIHLGRVRAGSRQTPQGAVLSWSLTDPATVVADGVVPFFIDWGKSPHPASTAAPGATLIELRAEHPDAGHVAELLRNLGLPLPVSPAAAPALVAVLDGAKGRVELR